MHKPTLNSRSNASRRNFLKGTTMASALALVQPAGVRGGAYCEDGANALPAAFSTLKPLGARVHPITADDLHGRLLQGQKLMAELTPERDAVFCAPGTSLDYFP